VALVKAALMENAIAAAAPNQADRHDREVRDLRRVQATQIPIAAVHTAITITQPLAVGKESLHLCLLMARKLASPATVRTVPTASRQPRGAPNDTRKMTTRKTSSVTMRGWTTLKRAEAESLWPEKGMTRSSRTNPTYQMGRLSSDAGA